MPEYVKRIIRAVTAWLSLAALLAIIRLGWGQLRDAASLHRHWHVEWIAVAIFAQLIVYMCIAGMFKLSLNRQFKSISPSFLMYAAFAFLFANRSLPGPAVAGVATLVYLLRGKSVPSMDAQAAAAAFYFADYAGFFTLIAAVSVPLLGEQPNHSVRLIYLTGLIIIVFAALLAIALFARPRPIVGFAAKIAGAVRRIVFPRRAGNDWANTAEISILQLHGKIMSAMQSPSRLAGYYVLSLVMHASEVATVMCGARAAGIILYAPAAAVSYVAGNLASIISVLPGAIGFYEAGMIGTLHVSGNLSIGDAAVCAMAYRVLSFWAPLPVVVNVLLKVSREGMLAKPSTLPTIH
jgi:uncharacterized protein (TIRG00374 family)